MRRIESFKKSKSGISTILGMLICVGILFSVVIPLFLYVNMVNNIYNRTVVEMRELDQRRSMESITVFAYPTAGQCLSVYTRNKCVLNVNVTRIWITDLENNTVHLLDGSNLPDLPLLLTPGLEKIVSINMSSFALGAYVNIDASTERGNVLASESNTLHITAEGGWEVFPYTIDVVIEGSGEGRKRYAILAEQLDQEGHPTGWNNTVVVSTIGRIAQASVGVPSYGDYKLTVYRWGESEPFFWKVVTVPLFAPVVVSDT